MISDYFTDLKKDFASDFGIDTIETNIIATDPIITQLSKHINTDINDAAPVYEQLIHIGFWKIFDVEQFPV